MPDLAVATDHALSASLPVRSAVELTDFAQLAGHPILNLLREAYMDIPREQIRSARRHGPRAGVGYEGSRR